MRVHPAKMHKPDIIRQNLCKLIVFPQDQDLLLLENKFPRQILKMHPGKMQSPDMTQVRRNYSYHFK